MSNSFSSTLFKDGADGTMIDEHHAAMYRGYTFWLVHETNTGNYTFYTQPYGRQGLVPPAPTSPPASPAIHNTCKQIIECHKKQTPLGEKYTVCVESLRAEPCSYRAWVSTGDVSQAWHGEVETSHSRALDDLRNKCQRALVQEDEDRVAALEKAFAKWAPESVKSSSSAVGD